MGESPVTAPVPQTPDTHLTPDQLDPRGPRGDVSGSRRLPGPGRRCVRLGVGRRQGRLRGRARLPQQVPVHVRTLRGQLRGGCAEWVGVGAAEGERIVLGEVLRDGNETGGVGGVGGWVGE